MQMPPLAVLSCYRRGRLNAIPRGNCKGLDVAPLSRLAKDQSDQGGHSGAATVDGGARRRV